MSLIGDNIRRLRELRGLSQVDLAAAIGESKQTIWKYESGTVTNIPLSNIEAISNVLHCSPSVLSGWEAPVDQQPAALSEKELAIIDMFRAMNEEGQEKVYDYIRDLTELGKYQKGLNALTGTENA